MPPRKYQAITARQPFADEPQLNQTFHNDARNSFGSGSRKGRWREDVYLFETGTGQGLGSFGNNQTPLK